MKKIKAVVFLLAFTAATSSSPAPALNNNELAFGDELMKELIKESVETVGKHLLEVAKDKYLNKDNVNAEQNTNTTTTTTTTNSTNTSNTSTTSTPASYTTRTGSYSTNTASSNSTSGSNSDNDDVIIID